MHQSSYDTNGELATNGRTQPLPDMNLTTNGCNKGSPAIASATQQPEAHYTIKEQLLGTKRPIKVIFMGMGAAGIDFSHALQTRLQNVDLTIYEKNPEIGGTWLETRYPGCACDIPCVSYQYSWQRKPDWTSYYAGSKEIFDYLKTVSTTNNLEQYVKFEHKIVGAEWLEDRGQWKISIMRLSDRTVFHDYAEFFLNGGGHLNAYKWPKVMGLDDFKGPKIHSANWDDAVDLNNKRVLVIGAGSSGVQIVPNILPSVQRLHVVARSPTWITAGFAQKYAGPRGANFDYSEETKRRFREDPKLYLAYCKAIESELSVRFRLVVNDSPEALEAKAFSTQEMQGKLAGKPELIEAILPKDFNVGCRRPTPGNGFLEALCDIKTNVETKEIQKLTSTSFVNAEGEEFDIDVVICATGFDTSFRPFFPVMVNGRNVQNDFDSGDTVAYMGISLPRVPNYFHYSGPYGPLGHGSAIPMIEAFTNYIVQVIEKVQTEDIKSVQVKQSVAEQFTSHSDLFLKRTAWSGPCSSWFKAGDKARKPTLWPGSRVHYLSMLERPRFEDFHLNYMSENMWNFLGDGFHVREYDGSDLTWYYGKLDDTNKQPVVDIPPVY